MLNYFRTTEFKWHPCFWLGLGMFIPSFWMTGTPEAVFTWASFGCFVVSFYFDYKNGLFTKGVSNGN